MNELSNLKLEIKKIENGEDSFLGIDGGNIKSDVWVCGVEFGGDLEQMENYYEKYVNYNGVDGYNVPFRTECPELFLKSTYDRFLAAMYINFFDLNGTTLNDTKKIEDVLKSELYNKNSRIFKLNLYPLAKRNMDWDMGIELELGINKKVYYSLVIKNRIKFIKHLVKTFKPKIIICTSPNGYENTFVETFLNNGEEAKYSFEFLDVNEKQFKISVYDNNTTKTIVIPFLGRGNLCSYDEVNYMANYLTDNFIDKLPF